MTSIELFGLVELANWFTRTRRYSEPVEHDTRIISQKHVLQSFTNDLKLSRDWKKKHDW